MIYKKETRTRTVTEEVITGMSCDNCGADLQPTMADSDGAWESTDARDSLDITINGGYAQFYDGPSMHFVFCHACSWRLVDAFPCIVRLLKYGEAS